MKVALKEWAVVVGALEAGEQILLFRKGGISESAGDFRMEAERFLLYPTFEHQRREQLKGQYQPLFDETLKERQGNLVRITSYAEVAQVDLVSERAAVEPLDSFHVWTHDYVEMRLNYKLEKPLYVVYLRVYRLAQPLEFVEKTEYVGCKSWVPLDENADLGGAQPVLTDKQFDERLAAARAKR